MIGGKYKIIAHLGSGGMGTVYRVEQVFLNKEFALKTLDNRKVSDLSIRRFQLEARAASLLDHPNLVQVYDFGLLEDGKPYLVMDCVEGITLAEHLKLNGPQAIEATLGLFAQACFGLAYAHEQGVVHRDIKPSNIILVNGVVLNRKSLVEHMSGYSPTKAVSQILSITSAWSNLQSVTLSDFEETEATLDSLNKIQGLRNLELTHPQTNLSELARQPFLLRLEKLSLRDTNGDIGLVIQSVAGSRNLQRLVLQNVDVSPYALRELRRCPRLTYLVIQEPMVDDEFIRAITQLKSVRFLSFRQTRVSPEQIKMLLACPWLTRIQLSKESNSANYGTYKSLDNRVQFVAEPTTQLDDPSAPDAML